VSAGDALRRGAKWAVKKNKAHKKIKVVDKYKDIKKKFDRIKKL